MILYMYQFYNLATSLTTSFLFCVQLHTLTNWVFDWKFYNLPAYNVKSFVSQLKFCFITDEKNVLIVHWIVHLKQNQNQCVDNVSQAFDRWGPSIAGRVFRPESCEPRCKSGAGNIATPEIKYLRAAKSFSGIIYILFRMVIFIQKRSTFEYLYYNYHYRFQFPVSSISIYNVASLILSILNCAHIWVSSWSLENRIGILLVH